MEVKGYSVDNGGKSFPTNRRKSSNILDVKVISKFSEKEKEKEKEDYDPYMHRKVADPTSNAETLFHLLKGSLGTGILSMPYAFKNSGYITGTIGTFLIGLLCTYCVHSLIKAAYELCKRRKIPSMSYPLLGETALSEGPHWCKIMSPYIGTAIKIFLLVYQLGSCCVYIVFVASNMKSIYDYYVQEDTDIRLHMVVILIPLILINWVRNLKYLAPFSTFANALTVISFGIILYYIFRTPITLENKDAYSSAHDFALYFGTVLFALEAIGFILPLENNMKTPKSFGSKCGVLNIAMAFIVALYVSIGLFGYLNYGHSTQGTITLNLKEDEILAQCAKGMLAVAIFISHALSCYVALTLTWHDYLFKKIKPGLSKFFWEYVTRTLLVLLTFLLAVSIPNLELFISLFGALCLSALGLIFPGLIQISTYWYNVARIKKVWLLFSNILLMIIGINGLVIGTYTSGSEIIAKFFLNKT